MTSCVLVTLLESRHKSFCERKVGALEVKRQPALLLIHAKEALGSQCWDKEEGECPRGDVRVCECQQRNGRRVERDGREQEWAQGADETHDATSSDPSGYGGEEHVQQFGCECGGESCDE